ncbi:hypothetical protein INT46_008570 [Mucor plumbeus]|uniref:CCHC-type domain-containing protein n=1 Tax=Mucor plumbeus TaxID=97098 RepID=A0A8H7RJG1_9FUNG|nr:hypothetical protein INT46_008570 [Mucor plumbeus]
MASSINNQSDKRGNTLQGGSTLDSSHNPGNQLFSNQSFTDAIKVQKRHAFEISPNVENGGFKPLNAFSTFVEAKERNSIVIDCAQFLGMEFKEKTLLKVLCEQYPKCVGFKPRVIGKNKRKAIELGFPSEKTCRDALLQEFKINDKTIEVNKTLNCTSMVINIGISEMPIVEEELLKPALIKTFERYGDILNIGISKSSDSDWFTGRGFATINRDKQKEESYAANLTPQVELEDFPGTVLNLVWSQMKPICPDCHTDEHIRFDCPKRNRKLCHRCKSPNHLQANCPTAPWNQDKNNGNSKEAAKRIIETESEKTNVKNNHASGFKHITQTNRSMEINLLELMNRGKATGVETSNQYGALENNDDEACNPGNEDEYEEIDEVTPMEAVNLETDGIRMSRSNSEPSQEMKEVIPTKSVSTPRSLRSTQQKKLVDINTHRKSTEGGKGKGKPPKLVIKRNLEEALSPGTREASTPTNKRSSQNNIEKENNEPASPPGSQDGGRLSSLD